MGFPKLWKWLSCSTFTAKLDPQDHLNYPSQVGSLYIDGNALIHQAMVACITQVNISKNEPAPRERKIRDPRIIRAVEYNEAFVGSSKRMREVEDSCEVDPASILEDEVKWEHILQRHEAQFEEDHVDQALSKTTKTSYPAVNEPICGQHRRPEVTERQVIDHLLRVLDEIVQVFTPADLLYIALDGAAPAAKQKVQRFRRFHRNMSENDVSTLDSNAITPGTAFMRRVEEALELHCEGYLRDGPNTFLGPQHSRNKVPQNYVIILDGSSNPGEGEVKMAHFLAKRVERIQSLNATESDLSSTVLFTKDADMLLYALSALQPNVFVVRELPRPSRSQNVPNGNGSVSDGNMPASCSNVISIDFIMKALIDRILPRLRQRAPYAEPNEVNLILDFAALFSIVNNDYLPTLGGLDTHSLDTLDEVLEVYIDTFEGHWVDFETRRLIFLRLEPLLKHCIQTTARCIPSPHSSVTPSDPNTMNAESGLESIRAQPDPLDIFASFQPCSRLARRRFSLNVPRFCSEDVDEDTLMQYCRGIFWVTSMVLQFQIESWQWAYPIERAPPASQLLEMIKGEALRMDQRWIYFTREHNTIENVIRSPLPFHHLISVLPLTSAHLLPETYRKYATDNPTWKELASTPTTWQRMASFVAEVVVPHWDPNLSVTERIWNQQRPPFLLFHSQKHASFLAHALKVEPIPVDKNPSAHDVPYELPTEVMMQLMQNPETSNDEKKISKNFGREEFPGLDDVEDESGSMCGDSQPTYSLISHEEHILPMADDAPGHFALTIEQNLHCALNPTCTRDHPQSSTLDSSNSSYVLVEQSWGVFRVRPCASYPSGRSRSSNARVFQLFVDAMDVSRMAQYAQYFLEKLREPNIVSEVECSTLVHVNEMEHLPTEWSILDASKSRFRYLPVAPSVPSECLRLLKEML